MTKMSAETIRWAALAIVLTIMTPALVVPSVLYWQAHQASPATLQPPETVLVTNHPDTSVVIAKALQHDYKRDPAVKTEVTKNNGDAFMDHLTNAAARRGWYVHNHRSKGTSGRTVAIVLPVDEVDQLRTLAADPEGWTRQELRSQGPAAKPSSLDLTNVTLHVDYKSELGLLVLVAALTIGFLTTVYAIGSYYEMTTNMRKQKEQRGKYATNPQHV